MARPAIPQVLNRARLVDHGERDLRDLALDLAEEALAALGPTAGLRRSVVVDGDKLLVSGRSYNLTQLGHIVVLGAGKASGELAAGVEQLLGDRLSGGLVVVPRHNRVALERIACIEADHPVPSTASFEAGQALLDQANGLSEGDLAICVFTGGSSALASLPPPGVTAGDKASLHRLLLASGMSIVEINTVRKHVSAIKGGRLASAIAPAGIVNLSVSDVVGDRLDCITDPTVADTTTVADALSVLEDWELMGQVPASVCEYLANSADAEPPFLGDLDVETVLVTRGKDGTDAVEAAAGRLGLASVRLGELLEGEASTLGGVLATLACQARTEVALLPRGVVAVGCGGESTVTLGRDAARFGHGGPSQEAAVGAALALSGAEGVVALFIDTDGSDGGTDVAGGLVDWSTAHRARRHGLSLRKALVSHQTTAPLQALGDAIVTGPTATNANDLVLLLIR
jgi:glycerate 2-kinase